ncbi:MAG: hypothetical protein DME19_08845 [Verrucomicrobia bacterium]|nr:MAG: hypothetical protein DME19_08845 [Verrucomicrobiota bacterium]
MDVNWFYELLPNKRAPNQKLIAFPVDAEFERSLEACLHACGITNKSQFIRDAIYEKLSRLGMKVPASLKEPPVRFGHHPHPRRRSHADKP